MAAPTDLDGVQWDFVAPQGFSYDFQVVLLDENGDPQDLTGETVQLAVRQGPKDPVLLLLTVSSSPSLLLITDPTSGVIQVHFDEVDTTGLPAPKGFVYDLRVGEYRKVWGTMTTRPGVTVNV